VNMDIPTSGIVNRYIAAQGPLPNTIVDFWLMVWEQSSTTIIMLTEIIESGRMKCHQYWPSVGESVDMGTLRVKNISERKNGHCHYREFLLHNIATMEDRCVTHIQYTAWPDHGVPSSDKEFMEFVSEVRQVRGLEPIIVHCSAGIGRTGVLILMETAVCLIEANEPVYPLEILATMRTQRALLIQTSEQYKFVCSAILRAYQSKHIEPLAEYKCNPSLTES